MTKHMYKGKDRMSVFKFLQVRKYPMLPSDLLYRLQQWFQTQDFRVHINYINKDKKSRNVATKEGTWSGAMKGSKQGVHLNFVPKYVLDVQTVDGGYLVTLHYFARIRKLGIASAVVTYGITAVVGAATLTVHVSDARKFIESVWNVIDGMSEGPFEVMFLEGPDPIDNFQPSHTSSVTTTTYYTQPGYVATAPIPPPSSHYNNTSNTHHHHYGSDPNHLGGDSARDAPTMIHWDSAPSHTGAYPAGSAPLSQSSSAAPHSLSKQATPSTGLTQGTATGAAGQTGALSSSSYGSSTIMPNLFGSGAYGSGSGSTSTSTSSAYGAPGAVHSGYGSGPTAGTHPYASTSGTGAYGAPGQTSGAPYQQGGSGYNPSSTAQAGAYQHNPSSFNPFGTDASSATTGAAGGNPFYGGNSAANGSGAYYPSSASQGQYGSGNVAGTDSYLRGASTPSSASPAPPLPPRDLAHSLYKDSNWGTMDSSSLTPGGGVDAQGIPLSKSFGTSGDASSQLKTFPASSAAPLATGTTAPATSSLARQGLGFSYTFDHLITAAKK